MKLKCLYMLLTVAIGLHGQIVQAQEASAVRNKIALGTQHFLQKADGSSTYVVDAIFNTELANGTFIVEASGTKAERMRPAKALKATPEVTSRDYLAIFPDGDILFCLSTKIDPRQLQAKIVKFSPKNDTSAILYQFTYNVHSSLSISGTSQGTFVAIIAPNSTKTPKAEGPLRIIRFDGVNAVETTRSRGDLGSLFIVVKSSIKDQITPKETVA